MKSLKSKILTLIISGLFVMMLVVSMIGLFTTNKILHDNANDMLASECEKEAGKINSVLSNIKNSVNIISNKVVTELPSADVLAGESYLGYFTKTMKSAFSNVAENTPGIVAYYLRFEPTLTSPTSGFFITLDESGQFVNLPPTSISLNADTSGDSIDHLRWFFEPYIAGKAIWMTPYYHATTDELMISYISPLYKGETFIGIAGMDVEFSSITDKVGMIKPYDNGYAYLTNSDSEVIFTPVDQSESVGDDRSAVSQKSTPLLNGMILNVVANYTDIQKDSYPLLNRIMISFVAVLVLFITVTIFVAKRITAPLEQLTMAAEKFAVGQKRIDTNYKSNDEIGKLAKTLQETTGRLEEYTSYINALAYRDSLTGVKNSTAFKEARHNIEKAIKSEDISFAIVVSDINSLKRINDSYGHEAGNELIRKSVKRICDVFAHSPVYRIGGDEFVAVLKGDDYKNRYELLARLENLTSDEFFRFGEYTLPLSVASGMAEYDPKGDDTFDLVFERADKAMYLRKQKIKEETLV
jgi:diguanylate cyclase (GGDEF)-like protein